LSGLNGFFYAAILWIAVLGHIRENGLWTAQHPWWRDLGPHLGTAAMGAVILVSAVALRAPQGVHALTYGTGLTTLTRSEYIVSGAASGSDVGATRIRFNTPSLTWPRRAFSEKEISDVDP
jgi:hypothetical protein